MTESNEGRFEKEVVEEFEDLSPLCSLSADTVLQAERERPYGLENKPEQQVSVTVETSRSVLQEISKDENTEDKLKSIDFIEILKAGVNSKIARVEWVYKNSCLQLTYNALELSFHRLPPLELPLCEELTMEVHYDASVDDKDNILIRSLDVSEVVSVGKNLVEKKYRKDIKKLVFTENLQMPPPVETVEETPQQDFLANGHAGGDVEAVEKAAKVVRTTSSTSEEESFFDCQELKNLATEDTPKQATDVPVFTITSEFWSEKFSDF